MLIPSYCSGAMVMITSLSRRVNANFECWNAWVDLADLAVMAAAGMALARLAAEVCGADCGTDCCANCVCGEKYGDGCV